MHIFVPALPIAAADLHASVAAMQMTVTLYILGLAFGQLVYGPLSDRFGRRPVLMAGLSLYIAAGLAAALAPGVQALIAARLFQAFGGCAGLVLGRAIVRDTAAPEQAARRLALVNLMVMLGPGLAPVVGGVLAASLGWRSIFVGLCLLGVTNFLLSWRMLPETGGGAPAGGAAALARNYARLLRSPAFLGYAIGGGCATTSIYAYIAAAPFIFVDQLHRPAYEVGPCLAFLMIGVGVGSIAANRLIGLVSLQRVMILSNAMSVLATFVLLAAVLAGVLNAALIVAGMFIFAVGCGIASPAALSQAISINPHVIGSASGLYGFAQMMVGALCSALAGIGTNPAVTAMTILAIAGVVSQAAFWIAARERDAAPITR